jgi:hypothetical protein
MSINKWLLALVAAVSAGGCVTPCPICPPAKFIPVKEIVAVPCPPALSTPLPDLPIFYLVEGAPPEAVAKAYHETAVILLGEVTKLNQLLEPYRVKP